MQIEESSGEGGRLTGATFRFHISDDMRAVGLLLLCAVLTRAQDDNTTDSEQPKKREQFRVIFEWKTFNFVWPTDAALKHALYQKTFIPRNVLLSGIKYYQDKLYLALPRLKPGVPATMAWIPAEPVDKNSSPLLTPFPSLELNAIGDCEGSFQSVQSFEIDNNGTMWIIDSGRTSTLNSRGSHAPHCPPSLSLIDLNEEEPQIVRYVFDESVADHTSQLSDIVVDDTDEGYAYITDSSKMDPGIIVFERKENKTWKFRDSYSMKHTKNAVHFSVGGTIFNIPTNVNGIALGPRYLNEFNEIDRNVYFCPLSSFFLFGTASSVLRNETFSSEPDNVRSKLVTILGRKSSQTDGMIMDEEGYLFFGLIADHAIAQWDHNTTFSQEIISKDIEYIQWVDGFAFDNNGGLFVVINRLQNFITNKVHPDEVNYRILKSNVGTKSYLYGPSLDLPATEATSKTNRTVLNLWIIICLTLLFTSFL